MSSPSSADPVQIQARHFAGLFLLSLATLLLELALTRILSVSLWYHFGFLVISTALLGFGVSGVTLALWADLRERKDLDIALGICGLAFAVCVVFSFSCMQLIPFDPFSVAVDHRQFLFMPIYFLLVALPFFCSGLGISLLLTRGSKEINRLYGYDLLGAGIGCALVALVIPRFGGTGSVFVAAFVGALSAVCFAGRSRLVPATAALVSLVFLAASFYGERLIPIHVSANKRSTSINAIYSAWNTMSLVQVAEFSPEGNKLAARIMYIDAGTAMTGIYDLRPDARTVLMQSPGQVEPLSTVAYAGKTSPKILIIGSGGGDEVLAGLQADASSITAIEINPIISDIVAERMQDFWGNLYHQPEVHLVTDEGRSFVRRSTEKYDAIISVNTISNAAMASGALSLSENYVLTREAFEDYLDHLTPDGTIFFTRPEFQIPRLLSTAREVFAERGMGPIGNHVLAFSTAGMGQMPGRLSFVAGFLVKKIEFLPEELREIRGILTADAASVGGTSSLKILYAPDERQADSLYAQIVGAPDLEKVFGTTDSQLAAATDDKPFFNQHTRWSRIRWNTIVDLFSQKQPMGARLALEDRPVAEVTLLILLLQSAVIAGLCILLPLAVLDRGSLQAEGPWGWLAYFAALGLGFIMVEIALLQRFLLFLGQPIYTYAVVLAGLLIFTGVGSYASGRWSLESHRPLKRALLAAVIVVLATAVITPLVFHACLGFGLFSRIMMALLLVAPLGFVLGMPFPLGLRLAMQRSSALGSWAWGVNGFFTVIGTVLALMLGVMIGFRMVLLLACACYLGGLLAITLLSSGGTKGGAVALREPAGAD